MTFARRPHFLKRWLPTWHVRNRYPTVLLTFDDGPHPVYTPAVLDRLAQHGFPAIFFPVGYRVVRAPDVPAQVTAAGHALGNHSFAHERRNWFDFKAAAEDVARCQALVPAATYFRPPFGRMTPGLWRAARRFRLTCLNWSLDSGDWHCQSAEDARQCADEVLKLVKPHDVILFHDDHEWIGPILDVVLPGLEALRASRFISY